MNTEVRAVCARLVLLVTMHFEFLDTMRKHDHLSLIDKLLFFQAVDFRLQALPVELLHEEQSFFSAHVCEYVFD